MPMIRETIVTTLNAEGNVHIAPLGLIAEEEGWILAPFKPSATLDNLRTNPYAVANFTDDVLILAGCLTGNRDWPTRPATRIPGAILDGALAHAELKVDRVEEDEQPRAVPGLQPRARSGDRGCNPCEPAAYAAAGKDRARARLSSDRGGEDRWSPRARGLASAGREDRGSFQARQVRATLRNPSAEQGQPGAPQ